MTLIGISGKAGVGKTTLATIAEKEFGFKRISFSALLKEELITWMKENNFVFNPGNFYATTIEKNEVVEIPPDVMENNKLLALFCFFTPTAHRNCISYRSLMQWFGDTKKLTNKDYWLQRFMDATNFVDNLIIDDVRFTNEAALIHALGGIIVRINWDTHTHNHNSSHVSETNLDNFPIFDSIINKEHGLSLNEFSDTCRAHLLLWLGDLDEPKKSR